MSDSLWLMNCSLLGSSVHRLSSQEYWSGLPFPSTEDLPNPGIKFMSPALAGRFIFYHWVSKKAPFSVISKNNFTKSQKFSPMCSPWSSIVLTFTFSTKPIELILCIWYKISSKVGFFWLFFLTFVFVCAYRYLVIRAPFFERAVLWPLTCLHTFVKAQLSLYVWVNFWILYYGLLI